MDSKEESIEEEKRVKVYNIVLITSHRMTTQFVSKYYDLKGIYLNQWTMEEKEEMLRPFFEDLMVFTHSFYQTINFL